jgi:hypothetical protein
VSKVGARRAARPAPGRARWPRPSAVPYTRSLGQSTPPPACPGTSRGRRCHGVDGVLQGV